MSNGPTKRRIIITVENDVIGDQKWIPTVARDLRALADLVEQDFAFDNEVQFVGTAGNTLTVWAGSRWKLRPLVKYED